jgi:hypothetical protein
MLQRAIDRSSDRMVYVSPVFVAPGNRTGETKEDIVNEDTWTRVVFRTFDGETSENLGWRDGDDLIFILEGPVNPITC